MFRRAMLLLVIGLSAGCYSDRSPRDVAQRFLDKYYIEIDQPAALLLCVGPASGRIKDEIADLAAARREGLGASPMPRIYYKKLGEPRALAPEEEALEYELTIDSQGVMLHKHVDLQLKNEGGRWRVFNFAEADITDVR